MTHRQRLQAALDHQEPDFVPLDFGTGGNTSPVPEVYQKLCAILGIEYQLKLVPHMMRLAVIDERILQRLDIDTRPVYMNPVPHAVRPCSEPGHFYDEWGVKWKEVEVNGVIYREVAESPLQNATRLELEHYPWWPDPLDAEPLSGFGRICSPDVHPDGLCFGWLPDFQQRLGKVLPSVRLQPHAGKPGH